MTKSTDLTAGVYVPVLNENSIKRVGHWDLGPVNNNWHLHRNYYQHIQDVLQSYQDNAARRNNYFNVLRFYLEDCRIENNEDLDSINLGLIIHAWQQVVKQKMKYHLVCATGDLYKADKDFRLKGVQYIEEKFKQFISSIREQKLSGNKKICFICVTTDADVEALKNQFSQKLSVELDEKSVSMVDLVILKQDDKLDQLWELLVARRNLKKMIAVLTAGFVLVAAVIAVVTVLIFQNPIDAPAFVLLDDMESGGWEIDPNHQESTLSLASVPGRTSNGLEISYTLLSELSWGLVFKKIRPGILTKAEGIRFYFYAEGAPNSLEFKLLDEEGSTFGYIQNRATAVAGWTSKQILFDELSFWWFGGSCKICNDKLDLTQITTLHIAISNKKDSGDQPGAGRIIIDDMQLLLK